MSTPQSPVAARNLAVIREAYSAFGRGDIAAVVAAFAPQGSFESVGDPGLFPVLGRYAGHAGIADFFRRIAETMEVLDFAPEAFDGWEDRVLVRGRERLRMHATGREVQVRWVHLFTLADGLIVEGVEWTDSAALMAAHRGL